MSSAAQAVRAVADKLAQAPSLLARTGADTLVDALDRQLLRDTHGDRSLSNLDARARTPAVTVNGDTAEVTAAGPVWAILEDGTKAHTITAKRSRQSRAVKVGDEWRTGPVRVRGVRPKRTYSTAVTAATADVFDAQAVQWGKLHG